MKTKEPGTYISLRTPLLDQTVYIVVDPEGLDRLRIDYGVDIGGLDKDRDNVLGVTYGPTTDRDGHTAFLLYFWAQRHKDKASLVSTIVHECVHLKQKLFELVGEHNPSCEFEAYMVQRLCDLTFESVTELVTDEESETESGTEKSDDVR